MGEADSNLLDVFRYYTSILRTIRKNLPNTKVYIIGLPNTEKLNRDLLSLCDDKHIFFISFAPQLRGYADQFKQLVHFSGTDPSVFPKHSPWQIYKKVRHPFWMPDLFYGISSTTVSGGLSSRAGSLKMRFMYLRMAA